MDVTPSALVKLFEANRSESPGDLATSRTEQMRKWCMRAKEQNCRHHWHGRVSSSCKEDLEGEEPETVPGTLGGGWFS